MVQRSLLNKLTKELLLLRKGVGLVPSKLQATPTLRMVIGHTTHTQADSLTNNQMYDFLLTEIAGLSQIQTSTALRYAFGVDMPQSTLLKRRFQLAKLLKKHPDTIERYENQAIQEFGSRLLFRPSSAVTQAISQSYIQQLEEKAKTTREMTIMGLASHLSLGEQAADLMKTLEAPYRPYLNATVRLAFLPSSRGTNFYRFQLIRTFQGNHNAFRIAVVLDTRDGERLFNAGLVDDFHQLNNPDHPRREIANILATSKFILKYQKSKKLLRLRELDPENSERLLSSTAQPFFNTCWILEASIPPGLPTDITYEHQSIITLRADEHFAYWYSPGLTYLKKLTLDFSQFPNAHKWQFFVQPFLGPISGSLDKEKQIFTVDSTQWILPGHGIALIWQ